MSKITTRLRQAEDAIERGLASYREAGKALQDIRDQELYKQAYSTFEEYVKVRWHWERAHAYRLIDASQVAINLSPMGDIPNERQARELTKLPNADLQRAAFGVAETIAEQNKAGKVTAKDVKKAVEIVHQVIAENPRIAPKDIAAKAVEQGATAGMEQPTSCNPTENEPPEYTELDAAHDQITDLQDMMASGGYSESDSKQHISDMRKDIKTLRAELSAVKSMRDTLQNENAALKKQCMAQVRKLKKYEGHGNA